MVHDIIIVGAGISGLACAQELSRKGQRVLVVDRSARAGGRLATRDFAGQAYDFGALFLHSEKADFLDWARAIAGPSVVEGWPQRIGGEPAPCQPGSLDARQVRLAVRGGLRTLADGVVAALANEGVDFRWQAEAVALAPHREGVELRLATGETLIARNLVLALASVQAGDLLSSLAHPSAQALVGLIEQFATPPCLVASALYSPEVAAPDWDIAYPADSRIVLLAANESSLHHPGQPTLLVIQGRPHWSSQNLEAPKEQWGQTLLAEGARLWGSALAQPLEVRFHRWKYSRLDGTGTVGRSLVIPVGGGRIALAGELFSVTGGAEGAWRSGREAAGLVSR